jgi:hypothetical protein
MLVVSNANRTQRVDDLHIRCILRLLREVFSLIHPLNKEKLFV